MAWLGGRSRLALVCDGVLTHAYGVRTGANAFCFGQIDDGGISLWADVRSGGVGVQLGARVLDVCTIVTRAGIAGESAFAAMRAFSPQRCPNPRLPSQPVYGSNDWYWVYGKNTAETVRLTNNTLSNCRSGRAASVQWAQSYLDNLRTAIFAGILPPRQ